jgi:hypothetical protein
MLFDMYKVLMYGMFKFSITNFSCSKLVSIHWMIMKSWMET